MSSRTETCTDFGSQKSFRTIDAGDVTRNPNAVSSLSIQPRLVAAADNDDVDDGGFSWNPPWLSTNRFDFVFLQTFCLGKRFLYVQLSTKLKCWPATQEFRILKVCGQYLIIILKSYNFKGTESSLFI